MPSSEMNDVVERINIYLKMSSSIASSHVHANQNMLGLALAMQVTDAVCHHHLSFYQQYHI